MEYIDAMCDKEWIGFYHAAIAEPERERDNALSDWRQADTDSIRALNERNEARKERDAAIAERDALVKALGECKEDSIELLGERDWWKDEPRSDYKKRYEETRNNITRADAALAAVKPTNQND